MSEHTPTPWTYEFSEHGGYDCMSAAYNLYGPERMAIASLDVAWYVGSRSKDWDERHAKNAVAEANIALIVRAVNSHEALVTALQTLREAVLPLVDGMDCYLQNCPCGGVFCDDCPGDDTCTCPSKLSVNAAMKSADAALAAATEGR